MKFDEAKTFVRRLAKLFPGQINDEQARCAAQRFQDFEVHRVDYAIRTHREQFEFVNWPKLYEACDAPPPAAKTGEAMPVQSFADVIRKQRPDLKDACDAEVILRYRRGEWFAYRKGADVRAAELQKIAASAEVKASPQKQESVARAMEHHDRQFAGMRQRILTACASNLCSEGEHMDWEIALTWAESVFSEPEHFRLCLGELRGQSVAAAMA